MSDTAMRYRTVAGRFSAHVRAVPDDAWANASPCTGWDARDIVRHLVEWFPDFLRSGAGVELPVGPSVDTDPAAAWVTLSDGVQALLDDVELAQTPFSHPHAGDHPLEQAVAIFFIGDVFVHTWDLARATGLDETLDPDEVRAMLAGVEEYDDALRVGGQYGPRVAVPADADEQTRLLAFLGRRP